MSTVIALLDLRTRVLHAAGARHATARCGVVMGDPWTAGRADVLAGRAAELCPGCWPEWAP